jgi:hypothetical protein
VPNKHVLTVVALVLMLLGNLPAPVVAQTSNSLGISAELNCGNFLPASDGGQQHAQAVYDADPSDPYGLDGPPGPDNDTTGEPGVACETPEDLGTEPPATCQDFLPASEGGREHAQALFDSAGTGDPYSLDADGNGIACDDGTGGADEPDPLDGTPRERRGNDQETLDGPAPERRRDNREALDGAPLVVSRGTTVVVSATPLDDFDSLEARLDARFAALEAQFAAFEVRAQNGFGRFDESADDASSQGQGATVIVSCSRQPAAVTQPGNSTDPGTQAMLAQRARGGQTIRANPADRLKARNDPKRERDDERKAKKRDHHNSKQRNRR